MCLDGGVALNIDDCYAAFVYVGIQACICVEQVVVSKSLKELE